MSIFVQRCEEWRMPLLIFRGDVYKAFDSMSREVLARTLAEAGTAPEVTALVLQELLCEVDIHLGGVEARNVPYNSGGKQGGCSTPALWRRYLDAAVGKRLVELQHAGVGFTFVVDGVEHCCNHFIFADDVWLLAPDFDTLQLLLTETTAGLHRTGLQWKQDEKLRFSANAVAQSVPEELVFQNPSGGEYRAPRKGSIDVLGHILDVDGQAAVSIGHRLGAMTGHFWNRRALTCRRLPLTLRLWRYQQTVRATPVYASGTFRWTQESAQRVAAVDHRLVRSMWGPKKKADEGWGEWQERTYRGSVALLLRAGLPTLLEMMLRCQHQWAGHVARLPHDHLVAVVSRWRSSVWWKGFHDNNMRVDPRNNTGWKHARPGGYVRWDTPLVNRYGLDWESAAQDRNSWKRGEDDYVRKEHSRLRPKHTLTILDG